MKAISRTGVGKSLGLYSTLSTKLFSKLEKKRYQIKG